MCPAEGEFKLTGIAENMENPTEGILMVYSSYSSNGSNGKWGTVCAKEWLQFSNSFKVYQNIYRIKFILKL